MEIPRAPLGGVSQRAAAVAGAINPTQRAIAKTATERAAGRDLMGAGETLQALTQRVADERETAENREDIIDTQMEGARIFKEWQDRIDTPGYEYSEADDEELDAALQTVADSARHDSGQFAARRMLQGEQIRFMEKRDAGLQATAERNARDAAREGAQYALSIGNFDLAENAADMGRRLGARVEWAESIKRQADVGRGMAEFNAAWEGETFEEGLANATAFVDRYSNRSNIIPSNRDAAVRAMRTELEIKQKAHKSRMQDQARLTEAEALGNYYETQRGIEQDQPYTASQLDLMFDQGAFGPPDSNAAVQRKFSLLGTLDKQEAASEKAMAVEYAVANGKRIVDPNGQSLVNNAFKQSGRQDMLTGSEQLSPQAYDYIAEIVRTGFMPAQMKNFFDQGVAAGAPESASRAYELYTHMKNRVGVGSGLGEMSRDSMAFYDAVDSRVAGGADPVQAIAGVREVRDIPKEQRDYLRTQYREEKADNVDAFGELWDKYAEDFTQMIDSPFSDVEVPPGLLAAYDANVQQLYMQHGDLAAAQETAFKQMRDKVGVTAMGQTPSLVLYPPEEMYGADTATLRNDVVTTLDEAKLNVSGVQLLGDSLTGKGLGHKVTYTDEFGFQQTARYPDGEALRYVYQPPTLTEAEAYDEELAKAQKRYREEFRILKEDIQTMSALDKLNYQRDMAHHIARRTREEFSDKTAERFR